MLEGYSLYAFISNDPRLIPHSAHLMHLALVCLPFWHVWCLSCTCAPRPSPYEQLLLAVVALPTEREEEARESHVWNISELQERGRDLALLAEERPFLSCCRSTFDGSSPASLCQGMADRALLSEENLLLL